MSPKKEGMEAGRAAPHSRHGKSSSEPRYNPNANSSSGSNGDKSGLPCKISGTRGSFIVKGAKSEIKAKGGIYSGHCSGFADAKRAAQEVFADTKRAAPEDHDRCEECPGTDGSFKAEDGGIIDAGEEGICSGAFSRGKNPSTSMPSFGGSRDIKPR